MHKIGRLWNFIENDLRLCCRWHHGSTAHSDSKISVNLQSGKQILLSNIKQNEIKNTIPEKNVLDSGCRPRRTFEVSNLLCAGLVS